MTVNTRADQSGEPQLYVDATSRRFIEVGLGMDINEFCTKPLYIEYFITEDEWDTLKLVHKWLRPFKFAIDRLSNAQWPNISTAVLTFMHLHNSLISADNELPALAEDFIYEGLRKAFAKLSKYVGLFLESPYYLWTAHEPFSFQL